MMNKIVILLSLVSLFFRSEILAQESFSHEVGVQDVKIEGYYKIQLSPELIGLLNNNRGNIRLHDKDDNEEAFFMSSDAPADNESKFIEYKIQHKVSIKDSITRVEFTNEYKEKINNISISVSNNAVQKKASLSGSNNQVDWFIIKDNYLLNGIANSDKTSQFKIFKFPLVNYKFLRLEIEDKNELPINVIKVGYFKDFQVSVKKTVYPVEFFHLKDSNKTSYYRIDFKSIKYFENIRFGITNENFYSRSCRLKERIAYLDRKKDTVIRFNTIGSFKLNSNDKKEFYFGPSSHQEVYLEIDNKDDKPLSIGQIKASFFNKYLVAKLKPGNSYKIKIGNSDLKQAEYDLQKFKSELSIEEPAIKHAPIHKIAPSEAIRKEVSVFESSYFIWGSIIVVGLFLAFISFKMIKEIK